MITISTSNIYASDSGFVSKEVKPVNSIGIQTNESTKSKKYSDSWSIRFIQKRNDLRRQQKRERELKSRQLSVEPNRVQEKKSLEEVKRPVVSSDHKKSLNLNLKVNDTYQEGSVIKASNRQTIDEVLRDLRNLRPYSNGPEVPSKKDCNKHLNSQAKPSVTNLLYKPSSRVVSQKCTLQKVKKHPIRDIHTTGRRRRGGVVGSPKLRFKRNLSMNDFLIHHSIRNCRLKGSSNCKSWDFTFVKVGTPTSSWDPRDARRAEMYAPRPFRVLTAVQALKVGASRGPNPVFIQDVKTGAIMQIIHNDEISREIRIAAGTGKVFPGGTLIAYQGKVGRGIKYDHFDIQSTDSQYILDMIRANMFGEYEVCSRDII